MMKKIKKIIALMLVMSLLASLPLFAQANEEIDITQTEVFKKLEAFGIVSEQDEILHYTSVSRGLFVHYAMRLRGDAHLYADLESPFSDVTEKTIGAKEIIRACAEGIISGKTSDRFYPDAEVTKNEAAKILISLLGYGDIAQLSGGYPSGYVNLANRFDLFKGCTSSSQDIISVADFLVILLNTLETEIPQIESIIKKDDSFSAGYIVNAGNTLLATAFGIHKTTGIIETNEYTSINGISDIEKGTVAINGKIYDKGTTDAALLLGHNTEFYYRENEGIGYNEIVFISPYKNNVYEVDSRDIVKTGLTTTKFRYRENGENSRVTDIRISKAATMIYNGGQKKISVEDLVPKNGSVVLVDNDRDNVIDVVNVTNYKTMLVSGISGSTYTVSDLLSGETIVLDPEAEEYDFIIYKDGEEVDFSSIKSRDVLSYAESKGNKINFKTVIISSKTVQGTFDAISDDYIEIDGESYSVDEEIAKNFKLGEYALYYLDFKDQVVAKKTSNDAVYGYLNEIGKDTFGKKVVADIFTENNRWVKLEFSEKVKFNGTKEDAVAVYDELTKTGSFRQLIKYTVDENRKINMINTATEFEEYSEEEEIAIEQDTFRKYSEIASARYRAPSKTLGNTVRIDDSTKIFVIPDQSERVASEDEFSVMGRIALGSDDEFENITPYDMDRSRLAKAVIFYGHKAVVSEESAFMIVEKIIKMANSDGVWTTAVKGYYNGDSITLAAKSESVYGSLEENLAAGDVIQIRLDEYGNITNLTLRYNASAGENQKFVTNSLYSASTFIGGTVHYSDVEQLTLIADGPDSKILIMTNASTDIMVFNTEDATLTMGTMADLEKGCNFVSRVSHYVAEEIIVYH